MKIVHLGPSVLPMTYQLGGAVQLRMLELAKAQAARGEKVIIYSAGPVPARSEHEGVEIRTVACRLEMPFRDIEYLRKAIRELRREPADVLHFHSLAEGAALSTSISSKKFLSFDYFMFRRGKETPLFWWYRGALRKFSSLLPVSKYCQCGYEAYWGSNDVPIRILPNGVNLKQFRPDPASGEAKRRSLGIGKEPVILYVGRVCYQKGSDILIEAFERLRRNLANVRLVVAGPAEQFGNLKQSELTRRIEEVGGTYLGSLHDKDLLAVYNMCDVFVMPTRRLEMFGMAALEAQACGKPVVCSRHGGLPEVVSPKSGLFFPSGDSAALSEELGQLLGDDILRNSTAMEARDNASRFGWDRIAERSEDIYRKSA